MLSQVATYVCPEKILEYSASYMYMVAGVKRVVSLHHSEQAAAYIGKAMKLKKKVRCHGLSRCCYIDAVLVIAVIIIFVVPTFSRCCATWWNSSFAYANHYT